MNVACFRWRVLVPDGPLRLGRAMQRVVGQKMLASDNAMEGLSKVRVLPASQGAAKRIGQPWPFMDCNT